MENHVAVFLNENLKGMQSPLHCPSRREGRESCVQRRRMDKRSVGKGKHVIKHNWV